MPSWRLWLPPALEKPRVRLYALGHGISVIGSWVQAIALSWLVFRLTGDVFVLGVMGFLLQIPFLLLGPFSGAIVDRLPKLTMLIGIDLALSALALALAILAWSGVHDVRVYLAAALLHGALNAFEMPTRQALLARVVEDRALVPSALGLSATLFNGGRLVGPAIAGVALLHVSEAWCFLANALSNIAIITALLAMRLPPETAARVSGPAPAGLLASWSVLSELPAVRYLLPMMSAIGLFTIPYIHLMPSIATDFFVGGSATYGLLMSASGFGALSAAFWLSMQRGTSVQRRLVTLAPLVLGAAFALFAVSRTLWLSLPLLFLIGAAVMCSANATNVLLQQSVSDAWRGRVVGLYAMAFQGVGPIGTLAAGAMAARIGLSATLLINGLVVLAVALVLRRSLARDPAILARIGVEPELDAPVIKSP